MSETDPPMTVKEQGQLRVSREWMLEQRKRRGEALCAHLKSYYACGSTTAIALTLQDLKAAGFDVAEAYREFLNDFLTRENPTNG